MSGGNRDVGKGTPASKAEVMSLLPQESGELCLLTPASLANPMTSSLGVFLAPPLLPRSLRLRHTGSSTPPTPAVLPRRAMDDRPNPKGHHRAIPVTSTATVVTGIRAIYRPPLSVCSTLPEEASEVNDGGLGEADRKPR